MDPPHVPTHESEKPGRIDAFVGWDDEGKRVWRVQEPDGSVRLATEEENARLKAQFWEGAERGHREFQEGWDRILSDPDFRPNPSMRYLQFVAWKRGLLPGYRPTIADWALLAAEDTRETFGPKEPPSGFTDRADNTGSATLAAKTSSGPEHDVEGFASKPAEPIAESKAVLLFGPADRPVVNEKSKGVLTQPQYDVILALIRAGDAGLTKDQLDRQSKHGDARKIMRRLADSDAGWKAVLLFPGKTGGRYRIS